MTDLRISKLLAAYANGETTPRQLIFDLRQNALKTLDYNAWITLLSEQELEPHLAYLDNKSPADLPLFGIPFAIKDNIDLSNIPTTAACEAFRYTPSESAFVVKKLLDAGAIPLGKTNLDQFATGLVGTRSPYGQGKNVFNPDYISGGSSAGSAIATALGLVSFALGTDTAGSGRVPAVFNNLIGHKPTKGLLSCRGVVPACKSLDCVSIFSLTPEDAIHVFAVASDYDAADSYARKNIHRNQARYFSGKAPQQFTFGVPDHLDFFGNTETEALFFESIHTLQKLGGQKNTLNFSPFLETAKLLYEGPWVAERWLATKNVNHDAMLPEIKTIISGGNKSLATDAFSAYYRLAELKRECDHLLAAVDCVIAPTTPTIFTRADIDAEPIKNNSILGTYTNFMNLLDYAATAVPAGKLSSGVYWGPTFFSRAHTDIELLNIAQAFHNANNLPLGATAYLPENITQQIPTPPSAHVLIQPAATIDVVVCGAHLRGQPLNWQLTERGATLVEKTTTAKKYKLYALPDGKRPALVRINNAANKIIVEVWRVPANEFGSFVAAIPEPLGIGKVELENGRWVSGFICDGYGLEGARDISEYSGWESYLSHSG